MEEILALQKELASVQLGSNLSRISERNCIELVSKLQQLNLIEPLIFTTTGREYLTSKQLQLDIHDEILLRGGRTNITDLGPALNVDLRYVERELPHVLEDEERGNQYIYLKERGEVLTEYYLDSVCEEIQETCQDASTGGVISLGDLATRFNLPIDMVTSAITKRLDHVIKAKLEDNKLYTNQFVERTSAIARGVLYATTVPFAIADLAAQYHLKTSIVLDTCNNMLSKGLLKGTLQGKGERASFTPERFEKERQVAVKQFFAANGYIDYSRLKSQMMIAEPKKYVTAVFREDEGIALSTVYLSSSQIDQTKASIAEALESDSWVDVSALLPPQLDEADVKQVLEKISMEGNSKSDSSQSRQAGKAKRKPGQVDSASSEMHADVLVSNRYYISASIINNILEVFKEDAKDKAKQLSKNSRTSSKPASSGAEANSESKGSKKKGSSKSKGPKPVSSGSGQTTTPSVASSVPAISRAVALIKPTVVSVFESDYYGNALESDPGDDEEAFLILLLNQAIMPLLGDIYHNIISNVLAEIEQVQRIKEESVQRNIIDILIKLEIFDHSIESFRLKTQPLAADQKEEENANANANANVNDPHLPATLDEWKWVLGCHVLKTFGNRLLLLLYEKCRVDSGSEELAPAESAISTLSMEHAGALSLLYNPAGCPETKELIVMIRHLPSPWKDMLVALAKFMDIKLTKQGEFDFLSSTNQAITISSFLSSYDETVDSLQIPQRYPVDKKKEKLIVSNLTQQLIKALQNEAMDLFNDGKVIMADVISIMYHWTAAAAALFFPVPFKFSKWFLDQVKSSCSPDLQDLVNTVDELCTLIQDPSRKDDANAKWKMVAEQLGQIQKSRTK